MYNLRFAWMLIIVGLTIAMNFNRLTSKFWANLGWLSLVRSQLAIVDVEDWPDQTVDYFQKALEYNIKNDRAKLGLGMTYLDKRDEVAALETWQQMEQPKTFFVDMGDMQKQIQQLNKALVYYKVAWESEGGNIQQSFRAAQICQLTQAYPDQLSQVNQRFCQNYLIQNNNNLILNGNFNQPDLQGWAERRYSGFSGSYSTDESTNQLGLSGRIIGVKDNEVGSLQQWITLPADTTVKFSAWLNVDIEMNAKVYLLYVGWEDRQGKPQGSQLQVQLTDMGWTYLERHFFAPDAKANKFIFQPALLIGKGTVWIDDVQLSIISEL